MKITNKYDLPEPLFRKLRATVRPPVKSVFHVTELIRPPQITAIIRRHWDELIQDASELIWAFFGQVAHLMLAEEGLPFQEIPLSAEIDGVKVVGTSDLKEGGLVSDYKSTSVWSLLLGDKVEWEQQLNLYATLFRLDGKEVTGLQIEAFLRDWKERDFQKDPSRYPPSQVIIKPIPLWPFEEGLDFLKERLRLHVLAAEGGDFAECTSEEMWEKPTTWAFKRQGRERALKVFDSHTEAQEYLEEKGGGDGYYIETRPGSRPRCERYCAAAPFCEQFKKWKGGEK